MPIPMIKFNGKMVPAKKVDGKLVPDPGAELILTENSFEVRDEVQIEGGDNNAAQEETDKEVSEETE